MLRKYRQRINPPYSRKDIAAILGTVFILLIIPLTVLLAQQAREPRGMATTATPPAVDYMDMDVVVVYYGVGEELARLQKGLEIAREFYWRNSGLQLNLNLTYIPINEIVPPDSDSAGDSTVEEAINDAGYQISDFGGIFHISTDVDGTWSWGVKSSLDVGFSHSACVPKPSGCWIPTGVVYPGDDPSVNYGIVWVFTHEFQHAVDEMYKRSGYPEMFHGDQPEAYAVMGGEQFSYQAEGFRRFNNWLHLDHINKWGTKWGTVKQFVDDDSNGIPDNDSSLPTDDERLGAGWDKEKYMAGIYQGSVTGPLYDIPPQINEFSPVIDGDIESGWTTLTDKEIYDNIGVSSEIFSAWDTHNLYLAGTVDKLVKLHLWLDRDGDGWWNGKNNLEILFDISSNSVEEAHALDFSDEARLYRCSLPNSHMKDDGLCGGIWDEDPNYPYERIITPGDIEKSSRLSAGVYYFEIRIPTTSLNEAQAQRVGHRVVFENSGRATVFEDYELISVTTDNIAPTAFITSPENGDTVSGTVTVGATASDNVGVTKVEFYVDGSGQAVDTTSPYSYSWDTTQVSNGNHSLLAKAYDVEDNEGVSPAVTITVANTSPDTEPPSTPTGLKTTSVKYNEVKLSWNSSTDNVAVAGYNVYRNNKKIGSTTKTSYTDSTVSVKTTYYYQVRAYDTSNLKSPLSPKLKVTTPSKPVTYNKADLNKDGKVNITDLSILLTRWGSSDKTADLNNSGKVDINDLSILLSNWGK